MSRGEPIDWDVAVATGIRMHPRGPRIPRDEAIAAVQSLRLLASQAVEPVRAITGLHADYSASDTMVVDRPEWIRSNVAGFKAVAGEALSDLRSGPEVLHSVGAQATAVQMGAVLGFLSGKVLGQYEAFAPAGHRPRLLLVAPSIVAAERLLELDPHDFRLWVCLHEETHRAQFTAVPWLTDHLMGEVHAFLRVEDGDPGFTRRLVAASRAASTRKGRGSLIDLLQTDEQRAIFDRTTALMSLLEGHADVVMDEVGPAVIPSVGTIRARFDLQRHSPGRVDGLLRRFIGLNAKMQQYTDGARFVRAVVDQVGMAGFNRVWESPASLPSLDEIGDPDSWVRRVCT